MSHEIVKRRTSDHCVHIAAAPPQKKSDVFPVNVETPPQFILQCMQYNQTNGSGKQEKKLLTKELCSTLAPAGSNNGHRKKGYRLLLMSGFRPPQNQQNISPAKKISYFPTKLCNSSALKNVASVEVRYWFGTYGIRDNKSYLVRPKSMEVQVCARRLSSATLPSWILDYLTFLSFDSKTPR